jgi:hypothetical protein
MLEEGSSMTIRTFVSAMLTLGLAAAGCANASDTGDDGVDHPVGADQLILRVSMEGGFVPIEYTLTALPGFSLLGDGTVVTLGPQIEIYPGPALPALVATPVSEEGVQQIIRYAVDAGLLEDRSYEDMGSVGIADASTTVFTLNAAGVTHTTRVYALSELAQRPPRMSDEEFEARRVLQDFQVRLGTLRTWLPEGSVGDDGAYAPAAMRVFVGEYRPDPGLTQSPIDWPLTPGLGGFGTPAPPSDLRCGVVDGDDLATLMPLAQQANQLTPWVSDGTRYGIIFRPLLPGESGC